MKCLNCDSEDFEEKNIRFSPEIKGEAVDVVVPCFICTACNSSLMDGNQMNQLRRAAADKYRQLHGLLTSQQIIAYRESLGMSQAHFAHYLNVGEASIKRWETYFVQDASQDEHIRLKCDESYAEINYLNIVWTHQEPDEYSGGKKFSFELFKNVALYLVSKAKVDILFLNKLHFYVDFLHYKSFGKSITGARYVPLKLGPCPDQYKVLYSCMENSGILEKKGTHGYKTHLEPDLSVFDDQEKQTLEKVFRLLKLRGKTSILDLSHEEVGFIKTNEGAFISYAYAKDIKLA